MKNFIKDINIYPILIAMALAIGEIVIHPMCYRNYIFSFVLVGVLMTLLSLVVVVVRLRMDRKVNFKSLFSSLAIPFLVAMLLSLHAEIKDDVKKCYKEYIEWIDE